MLELPFQQIHMEMANRNYAMLKLIEKYGFGGKDVGLGVIDVHTDRIETVEEIVAGVRRVLPYFKPEQIWLLPDCGLKERSDRVAQAKLKVMCEAAAVCRQGL
jgi:5-methyltetrahydropteroyltriglutamate--homocysteine methyltransferase